MVNFIRVASIQDINMRTSNHKTLKEEERRDRRGESQESGIERKKARERDK